MMKKINVQLLTCAQKIELDRERGVETRISKDIIDRFLYLIDFYEEKVKGSSDYLRIYFDVTANEFVILFSDLIPTYMMEALDELD